MPKILNREDAAEACWKQCSIAWKCTTDASLGDRRLADGSKPDEARWRSRALRLWTKEPGLSGLAFLGSFLVRHISLLLGPLANYLDLTARRGRVSRRGELLQQPRPIGLHWGWIQSLATKSQRGNFPPAKGSRNLPSNQAIAGWPAGQAGKRNYRRRRSTVLLAACFSLVALLCWSQKFPRNRTDLYYDIQV